MRGYSLLTIYKGTLWYVDLVNFLVYGMLPPDLNSHQKKRFLHDAKRYKWDEPFLFQSYADKII